MGTILLTALSFDCIASVAKIRRMSRYCGSDFGGVSEK